MTLEQDIERIARQEERLVLDTFDATRAWGLGLRLQAMASARSLAVTIEIRHGGHTVFFHAMQGTSPVNADWARRKRNVVDLLWQSSYGVGRALLRDDTTLEAKLGLPTRDYAAHGGAFPLRVLGCGCVGVVTVSGLPQRADHAMVVEALCAECGVDPAMLALD